MPHPRIPCPQNNLSSERKSKSCESGSRPLTFRFLVLSPLRVIKRHGNCEDLLPNPNRLSAELHVFSPSALMHPPSSRLGATLRTIASYKELNQGIAAYFGPSYTIEMHKTNSSPDGTSVLAKQESKHRSCHTYPTHPLDLFEKNWAFS